MPKTAKTSQSNSRVIRVCTSRTIKSGKHKQKNVSDESGLKFPIEPQGFVRGSEKHPLTGVTSNVTCDDSVEASPYQIPDVKLKKLKVSKRSLSDSSVAGISQDSRCGYSSTVLKVESFDILHKLLNVCFKTASLDVLDASKILQKITPEIMNTVVKMLFENFIKSTVKIKKHTQVTNILDNFEMFSTGKNDEQDVCASPDLINPRPQKSGSSSSSVYTAVDVLMSFTGEKSQATDKKQDQAIKSKEAPEAKENRSCHPVSETGIQGTDLSSSILLETDGVIDVTDSVFKPEVVTSSVNHQIPAIIDTLPCSETGSSLHQSWMQPFQYTVAKNTNVTEKQLVQDDLNLLPNIQSILNPVSPLSGVPEMSINMSGGFSPLSCDGTSLAVKAEHGQQGSINPAIAQIAHKKSNLRTILPKPILSDNTMKTSRAAYPIQQHRNIEHMVTPSTSIPLTSLLPSMTYAETPTVSSTVAIKPLPLIGSSPLLINQTNIGNLLASLNCHNVIFDPSILNTTGKSKESQTLSSPVCSVVNLPMFEKSSFSTATLSHIPEKSCQPGTIFQQSSSQGTTVTYTESLKDKIAGDVEQRLLKEEAVVSPQKLEKGSNLEAASALLSMGSRNKDAKNNSQVVSNFNRQRHTFDIEEQSLGQRGDILFTSTGTFQIEDIEIDPKKNKIEKDNYACGKCGRVFTSIIYLARHIKRVCPDMTHRKWKCDRCEKAFRHPFGLQQHIYTHTGERPFKCEQCSKAFYSANDLRRHKRTHSGERPYQCSHCSKAFSTTISLKTHTYIHTGERPHKCPVCGKTFATSSKLSRHVVTHSDQRPFACDLCPKTFNRSGDLRRHYNHVHQQEHGLMECDECNKVFATSKCLLHHKATHNRDKPQERLESPAEDHLKFSLKEER